MLRKKMPVMAELRWAIAVRLLGWCQRLTEREMSSEGLHAFAALAEHFVNDPQSGSQA